MDLAFQDRLDGKITEEFWVKKSAEWQQEETQIRESLRSFEYKIRGSENLNFAIPINYLRGLVDSPVATAMSLDEMRMKLNTSGPDAFKSESFPARWK
jgi:hypothetical protein